MYSVVFPDHNEAREDRLAKRKCEGLGQRHLKEAKIEAMIASLLIKES